MKFYVPTIGDKIYLEKDWTFSLYQEYRNEPLAKRFPDIFQIKEQLSISYYRKMKCQEYRYYENRIAMPPETMQSDMPKGFILSQENCQETDQYSIQSIHKWKEFDWGPNKNREITLLRGTELTIDRIYIKKGAPGFDSITWRITKSDSKKLEKARFWTKLKDANRIVCSLYPIDDKEAPIASRFDKLE